MTWYGLQKYKTFLKKYLKWLTTTQKVKHMAYLVFILIIVDFLSFVGPIWTHLDPFRPIKTDLDQVGALLTYLYILGPIWTYLDMFRPI